MTRRSEACAEPLAQRSGGRVLSPGARGRVFGIASRIESGRLDLVLPGHAPRSFEGGAPGPAASLEIRDPRLPRRVAFGGEIAFGEAYVDGWWDADDPAALIELFHRNPRLFDAPESFGGLVARVAHRMLELVRRNTRAGSRRNIRRHYDLGDDLFESFLDPSMSYSCALWDGPGDTLEAAQLRKIDAVLDAAALPEGGRLLEIGCGWGALAVAAAGRAGCRVDGVTLSRNQLRAARRRAEASGLDQRVRIHEQDYRDVQGTFDRIVSVEMIEAVGHENLPRFFAACDRLLAPGGRLVLQAIIVPDARYEAYRRGSDWLRKHIFPGGLAPSLRALDDAAARGSSLRRTSTRRFGLHYARTLRAWRDRFEAAWPRLDRARYDDAFRRLWRYYLAYCEGGFAAGTFDVVQLALERPEGGAS